MWFAGKENEDGSFAYGYAHYQKDDNFKSFYSIIAEFAKDYAITGVSPPSLSVFSVPLKFDDTCVEKVIKDITLSDLIQAYAELTLSFAVIDADGKMRFKRLYSQSSVETIDSYKDLSFEDYELEPIRMYSAKFADKKAFLYGNSNDFSWYVSDNILMRCRTTASDIGTKYNSVNFFGDVYKYRPTKIKLFSYWWLEAGDKYTIKTPFEDLPTIETFVFNKKMDGFITALTSKGEKRLGKEVKKMNKYNKIVFVNGSAPPLNADNLNHMDEGIERATDGAIALETEITTARGGQNSLGARLDKTDKSIARKLNSMPFDSEPKNNSPCYLTSGTVYSALLVKADKTALATKYDSSNIESGTSTLTPYSTVTDKIKSANCTYKTIGDIVIVSATVKMNAVSLGGNSMCLLIDLPYKCISEDNVFVSVFQTLANSLNLPFRKITLGYSFRLRIRPYIHSQTASKLM